MKRISAFYKALKNITRRRLFTVFLPAFLWGDVFDAQCAEPQQRVYRPTKAKLRLEEENRLRNERIRAIRQRNAAQNQNKTAKSAPAQKQAVRPTVRKNVAPPPKKQVAPTVKKQPQVKIRYTWISKKRYVLMQDVARFYKMKMTYRRDGFLMQNGVDIVQFFYNKRVCKVNGTLMYLTSSPVLRGALVYLNENDFLLVLDPVIRKSLLWKHKVFTIMIDAGHGGKDKGAPGTANLWEKNLNLAMALKVAAKLRQYGYRVVMTRSKDTDLTLQQRSAYCEKIKPDLFLSIHCNAVGNRRISGIETFAMTPYGAASTSDSKPGKNTGPGNSFDRNNYRLAYEIQRQLVSTTKAQDRGVKHARFYVLRNATCPAVLIETGFITNLLEGRRLSQSAYQEKIARGIASAVYSYMHLVKPPVPQNRKPAAAVRRRK
ncbi:MAG: N-acetylmuramoyl-L-alanine amidase [Lentisphaeria bacterium]|nr:N-acetylmuramoyl-L-alanine amidase [Lentisphaeria bacterium]